MEVLTLLLLPTEKAPVRPIRAAPVHTQSAHDWKPWRATVLLMRSMITTRDATNAVVLK